MQTKTILLIVLAAILALLLALFQYYFKAKKTNKLSISLSILRFLGVFGLLLLLINPKFSKTSYTLEKPNLAILVDNSSSVKENGEEIQKLISDIRNSDETLKRFQLDIYRFGTDIGLLDSLSFDEKQTDIKKSISSLEDIYARSNTAVIVVSDGNQTIGQDYTFSTKKQNSPVYTVTVGDTTAYEDLVVGPINTNRYAFLYNKYPLETYVSYQGDRIVTTSISILVNGAAVFRETVNLSKSNNVKNINTLIDATSVGSKTIEVKTSALSAERNLVNNSRETLVEVIDEKTNIALVSDVLHPDLGALKKAIESNEQRAVRILKPQVPQNELEDVDLFLLYQPNTSFKNVFEFVNRKKVNYLIFTGTSTDYYFLNSAQKDFQIESGYPVQEQFGILNPGFSKFDITDFELTDFPPLMSDAGPLTINQDNEVLLGTQIKGLDMNTPLLTVFDDITAKKALFMGEGVWTWRVQSFRNSGNFSNFDEFIGKLLRYLSSSKAKDRLNVEYNTRYEGSNTTYISATYFDEAYEFDPNANLTIRIVNKEDSKSSTLPMVLKNGYYEADLTNLLPGEYTFTIEVENENYSESGSFTISNFDVEAQFVTSDYKKMRLLSANTGGEHYFPSEFEVLLKKLNADDKYLPTQKSSENIVSLIDFRILLALIAFAFSAEWFIRKYNGLI